MFWTTGINASHVYVIQAALAGVSASAMYMVFRRRLSEGAGVALFWILALFTWTDVYRLLSFRLLSENLYFPLCPLALGLTIRALDSDRVRWFSAAGAGLALGLLVLTRPSFLMAGAAVLVAAAIIAWRRRAPPAIIAILVASTLVGLSGVVLRNYAVTGHAAFDIVSNTSDWIRIWNNPLPVFARKLGARILLAFGIPEFMVPAYRPRPHWMLAWLVCAAGLVAARRRREPLDWWEGRSGPTSSATSVRSFLSQTSSVTADGW